MGDFGQPPGGGGFGQPPAGGPPPPGGGFGAPPPGGGFGAPPPGGSAPAAGGFGGGAGGEARTEVLAIVSLVCGVLALCSCCCALPFRPAACFSILFPIVSLVTGGLAVSKVNKDPESLKGKELAYAGMGIAGLALIAVVLFIIVALVGDTDFTSGGYNF